MWLCGAALRGRNGLQEQQLWCRRVQAAYSYATKSKGSRPVAASTDVSIAAGPSSNESLLPKVALVGRPNVGKSALFNRLVRKRLALVHDTPDSHVTRDWRQARAQLGDITFMAQDTCGLMPEARPDSLTGRANVLTKRVLQQCHLALMLIDAKAGVLPEDEALARWLCEALPPERVLLLANKAEGKRAQQGMVDTVSDAWRLGLGEPVAVSAATGEGLADLYAILQPLLDPISEHLQEHAAAAASTSLAHGSVHSHTPPSAQSSLNTTHGTAAGSAASLAMAPPIMNDGRSGSGMGGGYEEAAAASREDGLSNEDSGAATYRGGVGGRRSLRALHAAAAEGQEQATSSDSPSSSSSDSPSSSSRGGRWSAEGAAEWQQGQQLSGAGLTGTDIDADHSQEQGNRHGVSVGEDVNTEDGDREEEEEEEEAGAMASKEGPLRLAIIGVPNAGKSSLLNSLLGHERALTGPQPGLTRDPVSAGWTWAGRAVELTDTPGWVTTGQVHHYDDVGGEVAEAARRRGVHVLAGAHVALLVVDAWQAVKAGRVLSGREVSLAAAAVEEGKALLIAANKVDLLKPKQRKEFVQSLRTQLEERFTLVGRVPVVELSALTGSGVEGLMPAVAAAYDAWNMRANTARLNRFLAKLSVRVTGSSAATALSRIKFMTQVKARPPSFVAFVSGSASSSPLEASFSRWLAQELRTTLSMHGVPLRIWIRYSADEKRLDAAGLVSAQGRAKQRREDARGGLHRRAFVAVRRKTRRADRKAKAEAKAQAVRAARAARRTGMPVTDEELGGDSDEDQEVDVRHVQQGKMQEGASSTAHRSRAARASNPASQAQGRGAANATGSKASSAEWFYQRGAHGSPKQTEGAAPLAQARGGKMGQRQLSDPRATLSDTSLDSKDASARMPGRSKIASLLARAGAGVSDKRSMLFLRKPSAPLTNMSASFKRKG